MRSRGYLLFVVLAVLVLVVFNLPSALTETVKAGLRRALAPYLHLGSASSRGASGFFGRLGRLTESASERERLEAEVKRLQFEAARIPTLERENAELRAALGFARRADMLLIPAEVIARGDVTGWWETVRLNKGRVDGVATNQAVVTMDGLVGRTIEVTPVTCEVLLLSDENSRVSAQILRTGSLGVVCGLGVSLGGLSSISMLAAPGLPRMDYLPKDADLVAGDEVVTTGLGGVFPAGLRVGRVTRVYPDESGLYQHADLAPAADLGRLSVLHVVSTTRVRGVMP